MIRHFGGVLIFIVSTYYGFYFSNRLKKRRDFLRAISGALSFIATEMEFTHRTLESIFRRVETRPALCDFFSHCIRQMEEDGIRKAWQESVFICADEAGLKSEDKESLIQLGSQIGMSDIEGQKTSIRRTIAHMDEYAKSADEEYVRLSKPYRSCGILLGVFFLIIIV